VLPPRIRRKRPIPTQKQRAGVVALAMREGVARSWRLVRRIAGEVDELELGIVSPSYL
jgi:hypothetical protein